MALFYSLFKLIFTFKFLLIIIIKNSYNYPVLPVKKILTLVKIIQNPVKTIQSVVKKILSSVKLILSLVKLI